MHEKGRTMQINSAAQMRQAIIDLDRRVQQLEELQAMDAELVRDEAQMRLQETNVKPDSASLAYVEQIEELVIARIHSWDTAERTLDGRWRAPLDASAVAKWKQIRTDTKVITALINDPTVWTRLRWFHAQPPKAHNGRDTSRTRQWVEVTPA